MFYVTLVYCEYRNFLLLTRVQYSQRATALCDSAYTESKDALCIQPSALDLSMNAKMCASCVSFRIVIYIGIDDSRYSNKFSVSFLCRSDGFLYCHAKIFYL